MQNLIDIVILKKLKKIENNMFTDNQNGKSVFDSKYFKEILSAIIGMMPDRHFIIDEEGNILSRFGNVQSEQFYDLSEYDVNSIGQITTPDIAHKVFTSLNKSLKTQKIETIESVCELRELKITMPNAKGPPGKQWFESRIQPLGVQFENKEILIASIRNITERKQSELALHQLVITDPLTKLYNRRYATDQLTHCLQRYLRYKTDITVLMLDIDFFKKINDTYGHDIGDIVLIELGKFLQANVRKLDTVARLGGEEFIIIMPDVSVQDVQTVCERLIVNISKLQIPYLDSSISITISGGLSQFRETDNDIDTLLKRVDVALYHSKDNGRNRITVT